MSSCALGRAPSGRSGLQKLRRSSVCVELDLPTVVNQHIPPCWGRAVARALARSYARLPA